MQEPNIILDILTKRSDFQLKFENIYKILYNDKFYIKAYKNLFNKNDIPKSVISKINLTIQDLKTYRYKWSKDPKPLIIDMLIQEVMRMVLNAIYEPKFSDASHAYRPHRGCHTALAMICHKSQACEFFIKGTVNLEEMNIDLLIEILRKHISDNRFLLLIKTLLRTRSVTNFFTYGDTYSGAPLANGIMTVLTNIYMNEFDQFMMDKIVPKFTALKKRTPSRAYCNTTSLIHSREVLLKNPLLDEKIRKSTISELKQLRKLIRTLPSQEDITRTDYRRMSYTRYSNEWLIGLTGTFKNAKYICQEMQEFLKDKLNLVCTSKIVKSNNEKNPVEFLSYNVITQWANDKITNGRRSLVGCVAFKVPYHIIRSKIKQYCRNGKPIHVSNLLWMPDFEIISQFQAEYKGLMQYYKYASNLTSFSRLKYTLELSLVKTLASKFRVKKTKIYRIYHGTYTHQNGKTYKVLQTRKDKNIIYFGGIPMSRTDIGKESINDIISNRLVR